MLEIERLTDRRKFKSGRRSKGDWEATTAKGAEAIYAMTDKLADYEDAEEQGLLIKLPKPQESDYQGLKVKYRVFKAEDNTPVENCFVLRPDKDKAAFAALETYSNETDNAELAIDIHEWLCSIAAHNFLKSHD